MIQTISGTIVALKKQAIGLSVGPIGIECAVPDESIFTIGSSKTIYTYVHWNQEQGPSLFGFNEEIDRTVFILIISCSGIGPRLGLAALAELGAHGFIEAVQTSNERLLSSISGIGGKKAEQIIVHLKHKVQKLIDSGLHINESNQTHLATVSEALKALNYSRTEVQKALEYVRAQKKEGSHSFDQLMRYALAYLSKQV